MRMATTPTVRKPGDAIARGDGGPHAVGRCGWRDRVTVAQDRGLSRNMPVNVRRGSGATGEQRNEKECAELHGYLKIERASLCLSVCAMPASFESFVSSAVASCCVRGGCVWKLPAASP